MCNLIESYWLKHFCPPTSPTTLVMLQELKVDTFELEFRSLIYSIRLALDHLLTYQRERRLYPPHPPCSSIQHNTLAWA